MTEFNILTINIENNIFYNCSECPSLIEIISINQDKGTIKFKCTNKKCINETEMFIKEYLRKMKKYKEQTLNEDKCKEHSLYNDNDFIAYCLDCNKHLCKECLKTGTHINHRKNNIIEVMPIKLDLSILEKIIKDYRNTFNKNVFL